MSRALPRVLLFALTLVASLGSRAGLGETAPPGDVESISAKLADLQRAVDSLKSQNQDPLLVADIAVYAKAADWILRHREFSTPQSAQHTLAALATGFSRATALAKGNSPWDHSPGRLIRGYVSAIDGSVQPYAVAVPAAFQSAEDKQWPLHLVLHGRGDKLNEIGFIQSHDNQPLDPSQTWIQVDVFGRTNNAYRWSGETDVYEALAAVKKRYRIDSNRIVLRGFSMGGAGSWHLGLHYPSLWCAVGPGAGFVDFYHYQNVKEPLPPYQHEALKIYDSLDYVLNAFDVPICTYGGELDAQLVASTSMVEAARQQNVPIKLIVGPGVGHKFHPESYKEFLAFLNGHMERGRPTNPGRKEIRFVTHSLKYNTCEWLTIEEIADHSRGTLVEGRIDDSGLLRLTTNNVAILQIVRGAAREIELDGIRLPLALAAKDLLPGVYYSRIGEHWQVMDYEASRDFPKNTERHKRHNLQGPIDDAFMRPFVCVRGTGRPWSPQHAAWAAWTLERFGAEFDKWLRGRIQIIDDRDVTDEIISQKNLILFGDPASNSIIARYLPRLPIEWTERTLMIAGRDYEPAEQALSLIYPNPDAPRNYIVINSGHTFHEKDFRNSNAWLFPRLGDIAVQKFERAAGGDYTETTLWASQFDRYWKLPAAPAKAQSDSK